MRLVGESGQVGDFAESVSVAQERHCVAQTELTLVGVRRHAFRSREGAQQPEGRQASRRCDVVQRHADIEMAIEEFFRQPDGIWFPSGRLTDVRRPHVSNEQPMREREYRFLALQRRATLFRVHVRGQEQSGELAIVNEWTDERS